MAEIKYDTFYSTSLNDEAKLNTIDQNWLWVFDNFDSIKIFNQYRPICDPGSILIATQDSEIAATASVELPLKHLNDRDGTRLLLSYLKHNDQGAVFEEADHISNELGGLPLAIVHVAGYIIPCHEPLEKFLKEYRSAFSQEIDNNYTILYEAQYEKTYAIAWSMALEDLESDTREFIDTLAFASADKVLEEIFLADHAVTLLRHVFPRQNPVIEQMTKDWPECARYMDQVLSFRNVYLALPDAANSLGPSLEFARILCDCGQYLWEQSMNKSAEKVLQLAIDLCDKGATPHKPLALRASILFRQCPVDIDAGYSGIMRAIPKFSEAIAIQEKVLEEMQRDGVDITAESEIPLANGLNNLGCCYLHLSRYDEAESILQES
ncbi:MAG: hypothetical protein Q9206_004305 [Seirophora lacunosa]